MKILTLISLAILTTVGGLFAGLYVYFRTDSSATPPSGVIVRDRSDSVISDCTSTTALARRALQGGVLVKNSRLTIIATGDQATADEPVMIADYNVPSSRSAIEGRHATARKQQEVLADLRGKCEQLPVTTRSPIVLAMKRAVERLRASGCRNGSNCFIYSQSDAEETAELAVKKLLGTNQKHPLPLIDNDGIEIVFCGLSATRGEETAPGGSRRQLTKIRDARRADRLRAIWQLLFTHPERVGFEPFCPKD